MGTGIHAANPEPRRDEGRQFDECNEFHIGSMDSDQGDLRLMASWKWQKL